MKALFIINTKMHDLIAKEISTFGHRTYRNQVVTDQEASSLMDSFNNTRRCYVGCWEGESPTVFHS